jgi:hypothetical protein
LACGYRKFAALQRGADLRRRHRHAIDHQRLRHVRAEAEALAEAPQHGGVTARAAAEAMIEADHQLPRPEPCHQHVLHEGLGLHGRQLARERQHHRGVETAPFDQRQSLLEGRDRERRSAGLQDLHRMRIEGARDRAYVGLARVRDGETENGAMAEVDAVEDPEGDR